MATITPPTNLMHPPIRKLYTPEKSETKAMTIAVGFLCNNADDLIIASDRQFTAEGFYKRHGRKLVSNGFNRVYGFAGDPGLYKEARQKIEAVLDSFSAVSSLDEIQQAIEKILSEMGLLNRDLMTRPLNMFIGINEVFERPCLFVFDGQGVYRSEGGIEIIGCGDTSLIHFLSDHLYSIELNAEQGIALGAYLIQKAIRHIDKVDGPVDVEHADGCGFSPVKREQIEAGIRKIEEQERFLTTLLIQKPFAS